MSETKPQVGDIVRYSAFGRSVNAIVMALHTGDLSHQGANGEPLLDLYYIDPYRESAIEQKQIGWEPRVYKEYSVVHASHIFSDEYKRQFAITTPAQLAAQRGQGEWKELPDLSDAAFAQLLDDNARLRNELAELFKRLPNEIDGAAEMQVHEQPSGSVGTIVGVDPGCGAGFAGDLGGLNIGLAPDDLPSGGSSESKEEVPEPGASTPPQPAQPVLQSSDNPVPQE